MQPPVWKDVPQGMSSFHRDSDISRMVRIHPGCVRAFAGHFKLELCRFYGKLYTCKRTVLLRMPKLFADTLIPYMYVYVHFGRHRRTYIIHVYLYI